MMKMDYKALLQQTPTNLMIISPEGPDYIILEVSNSHLEAISMKRENIIGKKLSEAFPDDVQGWNATSRNILTESFKRVLETKKMDRMEVVRYDIPIEGKDEYEMTYWIPENYPIFDENNNVMYIMHKAMNITRLMNAK